MGVTKTALMQKKAETSYNRFFTNAFTQQDLDEIVEQGGATSLEDFKEVSRKHIKDKDYWDRMFNGRFKGRDGQERPSKFNRLGGAVYEKYIKHLTPTGVYVVREVKRETKTGFSTWTVRQVGKGQRLTFRGKLYKGGMFLPKDYGQ